MKINIFGEESLINQFLQQYQQFEVDQNAKIVVCLGGDGTFLKAIHHFGLDYSYLPINYGSLGFFTSYNQQNFDPNLVDYNNISHFRLPQINFDNQSLFFVNEVRLTNPINTSSYILNINNQILDYRASGMEIVAPFGTTGCSRANMGPIISPNKELYSIKAILPVNNKIYTTLENPIICDYNDTIHLVSKTTNDLLIDGIDYGMVSNLDVSVSLSDKTLKIVDTKLNNYYNVLNDLII